MNVEGASSRGVGRVLIVDDHVDTAAALARLLKLMGLESSCLSRGREALRAARALDPDLILLDIGLPDINGYEVLHALRTDPQLRTCWVVAASGFSRAQDIARATAAGFDQYLVKPFGLGELRDVVRRACGEARSRRQSAAS